MERPARVYFHLELDPGVDVDSIAAVLQERLARLDAVTNTHAEAEDQAARLTGAEVVAGIALTVTLLRGGKDMAVELRKLIQTVTEVVQSLNGLKKAVVELGEEYVPVQEMDGQKTEALAAES